MTAADTARSEPTLSVGPVRITRITEVDRWPFPPTEMFPDLGADDLDLLAATGQGYDGDTGELVLAIHQYLVTWPGTTLLVDTGNGNDKRRPTLTAHHMFSTDWLNRLAAAGATPAQVDLVVNTHLHPDHCGWNTRLVGGQWVPTFPNARYLLPAADLAWFDTLRPQTADNPVLADLVDAFDDSVRPVLDAGLADPFTGPIELADLTDPAAPGTRVTVTLTPAPGHTAGAVTVDIVRTGPDGTSGAVISGDVIHHPIQLARPGLRQFGDADPDLALATRMELLDRSRRQDLTLLTAHFPA